MGILRQGKIWQDAPEIPTESNYGRKSSLQLMKNNRDFPRRERERERSGSAIELIKTLIGLQREDGLK